MPHQNPTKHQQTSSASCFVGIEIGGTKLQIAVGHGDGSEFVELVRLDVDGRRGAAGILEQIETTTTALCQRYPIRGIGIGFGGPMDSATGIVTKSHQVSGWERFPLGPWCEKSFGVPTKLGNDCDCAALAEARYGAGKGKRCVFYVTVGTGIGGGLVINGRLHGEGRPAVAEIGHLRPGLLAERTEETVESLASGPGIAAAAVSRLVGHDVLPFMPPLRLAMELQGLFAADLRQRCNHDLDQLSAKVIAQAAADGNELAREILDHACQALGWGVAQVITLVAPEVVVIGGGVSLIGDQFFFDPVRDHVRKYVFPPLANSYQVVPAELGELVVVHGALALIKDAAE